jgi:2-hydroxy-3-keto-5-methylthiopentenyl-1-phosphate phosphatase
MFSNHGEFDNGKFEITFPNDYSKCKNNAGTCKCKILFDLKKDYEKIIYIGDGVSDYCVADKADILYAKSRLAKYCQDKKLDFIKFETFKDINITG